MRIKIIALLIILSGGMVFAQNTPQGADNKNQAGFLEDIVLEDFENSEDWRAIPTCPLGETKTLKTVQLGEMKDVFDNENKPEKKIVKDIEGKVLQEVELATPKENHVLGIKTYFCEKGFDRVEVSPPHEYILRGKPRQFSIWVLGRNYRHTLYIKIRDYRGKLHKLKMGKLNFFGWRKLTITIPGWLPQSVRYALLDKRMHFVSVYVVAAPHEVVGQFYFYVDNLRYKSDASEAYYPGSEIKDNW